MMPTVPPLRSTQHREGLCLNQGSGFGIDAAEDTRGGDLITRSGVKTRPVFDLVADSILGESKPWRASIDLEEGS